MDIFYCLEVISYGLFIVLLLPILILLIECTSAVLLSFQKHSAQSEIGKPPSIAVLIPAHNESKVIQATLENVKSQLSCAENIFVVADNCTDSTAQISRSLGVTVLERDNVHQRGKGYALAYGLDYIAAYNPDVVVMVDADCQLNEGALDAIAHQAYATSRPAQAIYLMQSTAMNTPKSAVSSLAFLVKNWVRPLGLYNLGLPSLLTGTGMAFPWKSLQQVSLATGNIVEDMQVGLDLAFAGYSPLLCPNAYVTSQLPHNSSAAESQRTRWEHGHLKTLLTQVPWLLKGAINQHRLDLVGLALDLCVPPLSFLVLLWSGVFAFAVTSAFLGTTWLPVYFLLLEFLFIIVSIGLAWVRFGRSYVPLVLLFTVPIYVLSKIPMYFRFLVRPQQEWVRTERDSTPQSLEKNS